MLQPWAIFLVTGLYSAVLFAIAYYGDKRAEQGRSLVDNATVYALSMAVYCTAWTFYGSVGRAASTGIGFLPIYLGPTLMAALWWFVLRKIIRISKIHRITSIADFVASRYGKSTALGGLVTVIAVFGVVPYISLQLRAITTSFTILWSHTHAPQTDVSLSRAALYVAVLLAAFAILFGTRHLDVTEHHQGLVAAIAFESVVKLVAFLAAGLYVTYGLYDGFGDLFRQAAERPELQRLFTAGGETLPYGTWAALTFVSTLAILFLPRQFQMSVVENLDERHLDKAIWLFPLYLLVINVFVLPIAFAGLLRFGGGGVDADTFVLTLPLAEGQEMLALLVFLGGFSAATGMVIVATVALSTMVSNDLVLPALLRLRTLRLTEDTHPGDLSGLMLGIRRVSIVLILALGYLYFLVTGHSVSLVSIGLISFAAVAQFAPAMLGGIYWKGGNRLGALVGLVLGFLVWGYTLPMPSLVASGWLPAAFIEQGPWGLELLRPYQLFGLTGLDPISHSLFWSLLLNLGAYVLCSVLGSQSGLEHSQASRFVDVFKGAPEGVGPTLWRGRASAEALRSLLERFLGPERTERDFTYGEPPPSEAELVETAEKLLAGAIGAASARAAVASVVEEETPSPAEVLRMLEETTQVIAYSRQLERQSLELEVATRELRAANERLQELDRLKDEFLSTVTHELRTPLTSIRAFSEILQQNPDLEPARRQEFQDIVLKESERLSRLIGEVLDLAKLESGTLEWQLGPVDLRQVVEEAVATTQPLFRDRGAQLDLDLPARVPPVRGDRDRLLQVVLNLLSNALKFCDRQAGRVSVRLLAVAGDRLRVEVRDNGPGVRPEDCEEIFEKFRQAGDTMTDKPRGTGLGLTISRQIVEQLGGRLDVVRSRHRGAAGTGATFWFELPVVLMPGRED